MISINKKFARPSLLIAGCGDVGLRLIPLLLPYFKVFASTSQPQRFTELRAAGALPVLMNFDQRAGLRRWRGVFDKVIYLAPPPAVGDKDSRSRNLAAILPHKAQIVYVSTTGVYGDCKGAYFDETRPLNPTNARAVRRVWAERFWRSWAVQHQARLSILRVPGIYAADRLPLQRLQKATPALIAAEDVYTNHIHADDLAYLLVQALHHGKANRVYHAVDDTEMKMADYFDLVADHFQLARPPRIPRCELETQISPVLLSFMSESRRLSNFRIRQELRAKLRYPSVADGLRGLDLTIGKHK